MAGVPARLQVIADGRNSNTAGTAQSYVNTIAADFRHGGARKRPGRLAASR